MSGQTRYAEVIIPLAAEGKYTYSIPRKMDDDITPGCRVLVPFGKKKIYSAVVSSLPLSPPEGIRPREILEVLDKKPVILQTQLQLWDWMASYYVCQPGEVMRAALPSGLRPESESKIRISAGFADEGTMESHERLLFEVIKDQGEVTLGDLEMTGITDNPLKVLKKLVEMGAVEINEFVRTTVRKRTVPYIRLSGSLDSEGSVHRVLDQLARAPRQSEVLERYLELSGTVSGNEYPWMEKSRILENAGDSGALSTLIRKGILEQVDREELKKSMDDEGEQAGSPVDLSPEQSKALESIRLQFEKHQAVLLHGVTASGKTELYIHLIREQLESGKQVLYLLPEIALTTQIIERIRKVFGNLVGVSHSRNSDSERVHVYRNLIGLTDDEPYGIIIGVRSAIFLPFTDLGLVIIDEEHENTFKQHDPAPRYHARDSAQVMALFHGARVLMGSATPSFESLFNARSGKYGYTTILKRFKDVEKPEIILASVLEATKKKQMVSYFTPPLLEGIREALNSREQIILFQNRRGYSHYVICDDCGEIPKCKRCDVSLTYHRATQKMECHYCGRRENMPPECPSCGGTNLLMKGFGTEKIEEEIGLVFDGIRVGRLDTDAARSAAGYEKVIRRFEDGQLDVLIGTQMVSKGLDFKNVSLVGILDADSMLHFPDFRAYERTFQLISQVSGRAGRHRRRGRVIIQTRDPEHPVIRQICDDDYEGLFRGQMEEREAFGYPPFTRMIRISFRHRVPSILDGATDMVARQLKEIFSTRILGPQYPPVRKVQNIFIKQIVLKIEKAASYEKAKKLLGEVLKNSMNTEVFRSVRISVDVDPY